MSIIIGADIVPVESNYELFSQSRVNELIGPELSDILCRADYRIFNLETCLTDRRQPIRKYGPHLAAPTATAAGLKSMGIDLITLANNHIMDQDAQGLASTIHKLDEAGISHLGAGENLNEAHQPFYFEIKEKRYGVYACTEHEFSIAGRNKPGANPFDPLESPDHIAQMKSRCDYIIVLYHGGKEHYQYPSPGLQKTCRKLIDRGADLVVCQHSHCIGCKEDYSGGTIVYGQGNFLFGNYHHELWDTGILIQLEESGSINYIPVRKHGNGVALAAGHDAEVILSAFSNRSNEIRQPDFVESNYEKYAGDAIAGYLFYFSGIQDHFFYRAVNKLSGQRLRGFITKGIIRKRGLGYRNYIECEAHRELLLKGLEHCKQ